MMYSEFVEGTGCRDNEYNHKVFTDLEIMYMNSNLTKDQIYEYGKKLVDNSKTEEQIELEKKTKTEIEDLKAEVKWQRERIKNLEFYLGAETDGFYIRAWKEEIKSRKRQIKKALHEIRMLKWVLE